MRTFQMLQTEFRVDAAQYLQKRIFSLQKGCWVFFLLNSRVSNKSLWLTALFWELPKNAEILKVSFAGSSICRFLVEFAGISPELLPDLEHKVVKSRELEWLLTTRVRTKRHVALLSRISLLLHKLKMLVLFATKGVMLKPRGHNFFEIVHPSKFLEPETWRMAQEHTR